MFKKRKVVMLPTNERSQIWMGTPALGLRHDHPGSAPFIKYFHLYFLSDEEIKEGDCVYCLREGFEPVLKQKVNPIGVNNDKMFKKIIATTDKSLTTNSIYGINSFDASIFSGSGKSQMVKLPQMFNLPQPSQSFIEKYVEEYNKGNIITEVMVEYNESITEIPRPYKSYSEIEHLDGTLKINPKDNTITIRKMKDSWNREEMLNLLESAWNGGALYGSSKPNSHYFDKLIEENL